MGELVYSDDVHKLSGALVVGTRHVGGGAGFGFGERLRVRFQIILLITKIGASQIRGCGVRSYVGACMPACFLPGSVEHR